MNHILRVFRKQVHVHNEIKVTSGYEIRTDEELCNRLIKAYNDGYSDFWFEVECCLPDLEEFLKDLNHAVQKSQMGTLLCGFYPNTDNYEPYDANKVRDSIKELRYKCCNVSKHESILLAIEFD